MSSAQKICFVIMGFGKKTDYLTGKTFDLDKTYTNIIQPAALKSGLQCVRADEIQGSGLIDRSMYALLMQADLVVADISTPNPNAIYELGIRHAVKPYTTIVLKEKDGNIPFDINHTRIFSYTHLGEDIGADEAKRCQNELSDLIITTTKNNLIDSPLYELINGVTPPKLPQDEYEKIIGYLADKETHIFAIVESAKKFMADSSFIEARRKIANDLRLLVKDDANTNRMDIKWIYATLSNCYFGLGENKDATVYEEKFKKSTDIVWEIETFNQAKKQLETLIKR